MTAARVPPGRTYLQATVFGFCYSALASIKISLKRAPQPIERSGATHSSFQPKSRQLFKQSSALEQAARAPDPYTFGLNMKLTFRDALDSSRMK